MLRVMETLFLCMGEHIYAEGCGYDFTILANEKMILLFWQVENMILLLRRTDHFPCAEGSERNNYHW